jgi:tRNA(Ile)-lysidine synthase
MANGMREEPIDDREIERLLAPLREFPVLVLAVSGGADSMALLHLVSRWRDMLADEQRPSVIVATVDHGLRPESRREAEMVARSSAEAGFEHVILTWGGAKPATGVQAAARDARYQLLMSLAEQKARDLANAHSDGDVRAGLVTAHTQDDQAETVLMRLARGSGIQGLSGIAPRVERDGVWLLRPLLDVPKARLVATLTAAGKSWVEDPSNEDQRFERVRWREAQGTLQSLGLTPQAISRSARRLQRVLSMVAEAAAHWIAKHANFNEGAFTSIDLAAFENGGEEALRGLQAVMQRAGGSASDAELSQVETVFDALTEAARSCSDLAPVTLGGCIVEAIAGHGAIEPVVRVFREVGSGLPSLELEAGKSGVWDRRFRVAARDGIAGPLTVKALGSDGWARLKRDRPDLADLGLPARAAATLPAVWQGERLVAVPYFGAADVHLSGSEVLAEMSFIGIGALAGTIRPPAM